MNPSPITSPILPAMLCLASLLLLHAPAHAGLAEPDNILYGTLTLDNAPVTADRTDVVIEARRSLNDPPFASYRIGSNPRLGNFYSLRLALESAPPLANTNASQVGDSIVIVVLDDSGVRGETSYTFPERGHVQRVDFGTTITDADGNGLPDLWELSRLGAAGQDPDGDPDQDGQSTRNEFIAGTDPADTNDVFILAITRQIGTSMVSLLARRAEGPGYENTTRLYSLETTTNLLAAPWNVVPEFTDQPGANEILQYQAPNPSLPTFYRARVRLQTQ